MELQNKVALVLGGIKGIGKGIALALAQKGVKTAVTYWDWEESLPSLQEGLTQSGVDHLILRTNLLETEAVEGLLSKIIRRFGRLDILINNIERGGWPVVHGPYVSDQWDLEMATTLKAKWWVFDRSLPYLKASGDGVAINLSSISGLVGRSGPAGLVFNDGYAAANRAISSFTETWARLGAPEVRVSELMIGFIETRHGEQTRGWGLLSEHQRQHIVDHTLLKRIGRIEDIVQAILFMIQAPFLTGTVVRLDGGYVLGGESVPSMPKGILQNG